MIRIESFSKTKSKGQYNGGGSSGGGFTTTVKTELEPHLLWGQAFDGTNDVDGDMTTNGSVYAKKTVSGDTGSFNNLSATTANTTTLSATTANAETLSASTATTETLSATTANAETLSATTTTTTTLSATTANVSKITSDSISNSGIIESNGIKGDKAVINDMSVKNLKVTGSAHFFELIIDKVKSAGGSMLITPADGFDVDIVQDSPNEVKLLWQCQDEDGNQRDNMWKVNDQALCLSFNQAKVGTTHNVANKYYWALVTSVNKTNEPTVIDGVKYNYITLSKTTVDGTLNPEFGDSIVMCGYRGTDDKERQSAIYISAYTSLDNGLKAPLFAQYQGINDFNLQSHRKSYYDAVSAKFIGEFEATDGQNIIDIINNKIAEAEASIKLDTKNIVLSVSEKTKERRNLLKGTTFHRQLDNFFISSAARIEMNSGYNGTNCIKVIDDTDGTSHYIGVYWDGSQGARSIKIEKGKKYTISCYYKTNDTNANFSLEAIYTDKETNAKRLGRPKYLSKNMFNPKYNQWELFTTVIDTTDAESDYIAFNFWEYCNKESGRIEAYICRPMVEEGDTYYGWTVSDEDNDYIGANLIDNSRTFEVGGNTLEAKGTKTLKGDVYELTYVGSDEYNTFYRIDATNFKLDTDYTLSFEARGDAKYIGVHAYYPMTKTPYTLLNEPMGKPMGVQYGDGTNEAYTTLLTDSDIEREKKLWVHFKFMKRLPSHIYLQFPKNSDQSGVTSWNATITKPKIEEGANVTQWTEKKTDIDNTITTINSNVATLTQKADSIESKVTSNTTNINTITGQLSSQSSSISKLEQKANSIESTVSNMTKSNGTNLFSFTNTSFQDGYCRSAIQMNGFFTYKLNQRFYRLQNFGTNGEGGDFVVSFDARVLKNTTVNVNFCDIGAEENNGDIALTTTFQHYVLHFKNIQSDYLDKALYNGFIDFEPKTLDETNQLYVANFMLERGNVPSETFCLSDADKNNFGNKETFTNWETYPTVQRVNETINGKSVQAYKIEGLPSDSQYVNILNTRNLQKSMKIEPKKVYTLSFYAKASESGHGIETFLYPSINDIGVQDIQYRNVNGAGTQTAYSSKSDGYTLCELDTTWRKFYVHWHPHTIGDTYNCVCGRLSYNMTVYIAEAKLEEGYICEENISNQETYSSIKQTAESITSTVSSMKDEIIGENCMLGLNGQGWSNNTIYEDAGTSFHCESTDWFQSHPIADYSGDYTFSFGVWGGGIQIKILEFTQTYYDDGIYNKYVDFGLYTPCKILTTSSRVSNVTLTNYATSGTSSTWTYTNTETITLAVGDNVAVRVTNSTNSRYNSIYGTVSAINTSSKSVTVKAIALLDQPNTICTLSCPMDKKDGTDINYLHYDEKLGRYWIRFKESSGASKTFVMLFRNPSTSIIGYISRLMIEESVEYPHKYNSTGQASQSMIKQTANEIMMNVNNTYVKIGDGNITLNGDTKVNGSLTLHDEDQGFLLLGDSGTTEISPKSIGTYNEFKNKSTNVIKTHYNSRVSGAQKIDGYNVYSFNWDVQQKLGTFKKGSYIKFFDYTNVAFANVGTEQIGIGTPSATFYIHENETLTKTITVGSKTSVDIGNYTVVGDNVDVMVTGRFTKDVSASIWNTNPDIIYPFPRGTNITIQPIRPIRPMPSITVTVNWKNEVPTSSGFMLIGYDGFAVNFGNNKTVYCGADGFIASYGTNEFRITSDGIWRNNHPNVKVVKGTDNSNTPATYTVQEPVDTVLCTGNYCKIIFPRNPYEGQTFRILDKALAETYINSNGKKVVNHKTGGDGKVINLDYLGSQVFWTYVYIGGRWYESAES